MQREDGGLHEEGNEHRDQGERRGDAAEGRGGDDLAHVEGAGLAAQIEREDGEQQGQTPEQGVEEEGQRGALPALVAPAGDDEVHADECDLEEDVEQDHVEGNERPDAGRLQEEEERHVGGWSFADVRGEDERDEEQDRRQQDERQAYAVHADPVSGADGGDPGQLLHLREPPSPSPTCPHPRGTNERQPGRRDAHPVGDARRRGTHQHQERRAEEGEEERDGDEGKGQRAKPFSGTDHQQGEDQGDAGDGYQ